VAHVDPGMLRTDDVRTLQRKLGNRATDRVIQGASRPAPVQAKLSVGAAGDAYELEADRIADQVMRDTDETMPPDRALSPRVQKKSIAEGIRPITARPVPIPSSGSASIMRDGEGSGGAAPSQGEHESHEHAPSYGLDGGPLDGALESRIQAARGGGSPLAEGVRTRMESRFGADFGGVRVHTGSEADTLNRSLSSRAFTLGSDIFFRGGAYDPASSSGGKLLAHELTHTIQQTGGGVQRKPAGLQRAPAEVIQRAIGMELECTNLAIKKYPRGTNKKDVIDSDGKNAKMTVEATMETTPVVEFVVDPAAETEKELIDAISWMEKWATKMDRDGGASLNGFSIEKEGNIEGAIQITMGLPLEALPEIYPAMGEDLVRGARSFGYQRYLDLVTDRGTASKKCPDGRFVKDLPPASKGFVLFILDTLKRGYVPERHRRYFKAPPAPQMPPPFTEVAPEKFQGGMNVFDRMGKHFARKAWKERKAQHDQAMDQYNLDYQAWEKETATKKAAWELEGEQFQKALFDAMPRSSFNAIFQSLPLDEAKEFVNVVNVDPTHVKVLMKPEWVDWFVRYGTEPTTIGTMTDTQAQDFIEARKNEPMINEKMTQSDQVDTGPKRGDWLTYMPMVDLLKGKFMGISELGAKTDVFASNPKKKAPVFEFRKPYGSSVPYDQWVGKATASWEAYWNASGKKRINRGGKRSP
jgi:hypothetical protein